MIDAKTARQFTINSTKAVLDTMPEYSDKVFDFISGEIERVAKNGNGSWDEYWKKIYKFLDMTPPTPILVELPNVVARKMIDLGYIVEDCDERRIEVSWFHRYNNHTIGGLYI